MVNTTDEWIMKRVGIRERHIIADSGDTVASMSEMAARRAIDAAGIDPKDIELIIVGTASSDKYFPSAACLLQKKLKIGGMPAFDVAAACAGFIYCLSIADQYIRSGMVKTALVVGVDALSRLVDWEDRRTCVLFGDGAGAVVLQAANDAGVLVTKLHADGQYADLLYADSPLSGAPPPYTLQMQGHEVFKIAVTKLGDMMEDILQEASLQKSQIDWMIPHQANFRIIKAAAKRLDLPLERVILTVQKHGNTSAASIPLALDEAVRDGRIRRGQILLFEAFGAGFAWGSALVRY